MHNAELPFTIIEKFNEILEQVKNIKPYKKLKETEIMQTFLKEITNPTKRIYITDVKDKLTVGMMARFATDIELKEDNRNRYTSCWNDRSEANICYTNKATQEYRIFPITEHLLNWIKNGNNNERASRFIPGLDDDYGGWTVNLHEIVLITENTTEEKVLLNLIKVELTENKPKITPVLTSFDRTMIEKLKNINEKAIIGTDKEETTYYQILPTIVNTKAYKVKIQGEER